MQRARQFLTERGDWRRAQVTARAVSFASFAVVVVFGFFTPFPTTTVVPQAVRAANAGCPYYLMDENSPEVPSPVNCATLSPYYANDFGMEILVASISTVGRWVIGPRFTLSYTTGTWVLLVLIVLSGLLFFLPPMPLAISGLATAALLIVLHGVAQLDNGELRWCTAWTAIMAAVFSVAVMIRRTGWTDWMPLVGLALILVGMTFLREESGGTVSLILLLSAAFGLCYGIAVMRSACALEAKRTAMRALVSFLAPAILLTAMVAVQRLLVRTALASAYHEPWSEVVLPSHGRGLPLYVGLGFRDNPFNIGWEDYVGIVHYRLFAPDRTFRSKAEAIDHWQATLSRAWLKIVLSEPREFLRGVLHKAVFLGKTFAKGHIDPGEVLVYMRGTTIPPFSKTTYWLFLAMAFFLALASVWPGSGSGIRVFLWLSLAFVVGGFAGPLVVYPGYLSGAYGAMIGLLLVTGPAAFMLKHVWSEGLPGLFAHRALAVQFRRVLSRAIAGAVTVIVIWIGATEAKNAWREHEVVSENPFRHLNRLKYEYGYYFNRLSVEDQESVIEKIRTAGHPDVYLPRAPVPETSVLRPIVCVRTPDELHVFVFLSDRWTPPTVQIDQGFINSQIAVAAPGVPITAGPDVDFTNYSFLDINDAEWRNRYKMITLPIRGPFFRVDALHIMGFKRYALDAKTELPLVETLVSVEMRRNSTPRASLEPAPTHR